jgi:hypothetical protein
MKDTLILLALLLGFFFVFSIHADSSLHYAKQTLPESSAAVISDVEVVHEVDAINAGRFDAHSSGKWHHFSKNHPKRGKSLNN